MKIINVIPLTKSILKGDLTYFTGKNVEAGNIVTITLRNKKVLGLALSSEDASEAKINIKDMGFNLKKIIDVKENSIFLKEYLESAVLMSKYFVSGKSSAITSLIPRIFIEEYDKLAKIKNASVKPETEKAEPGTHTTSNTKTEKLLLQEPISDRVSIYKTLIRENFALKKSVFIVLPTENDIRDFEEYLSKGIQEFVYTFHGGLSTKKITEKLEQIISTPHPLLILGTAPFLSIPRQDIGVIILEHESSNSYAMMARPHIDLRLFTELFATKINAKFILSDTLLRFETIEKEKLGHYTPLNQLSFRINFKGEIDIEKRKQASPFKLFTEKSVEEIQHTVGKQKNVFIFALRKGLATETVCKDCGETVSCDRCGAPLVLYTSGKNKKETSVRTFICNKCGEEKSGEIVCAHCRSWNLMPLGIGTDTVYEALSKLFPKPARSAYSTAVAGGTKIFKLDKESAKNKKEASTIIKEFEASQGAILIGTEMALFYLKHKVALSIIASFDSLWSIPSFRMSEKILQLTVSIASKTEGKCIIQTKNDNDSGILAIATGNLLPFIREELEARRSLNYPPFKHFIKIKYAGNKIETLKAKQILEEVLKDYKPLIFSGFVAKVKGKYITNALIKMEPKDWSLPFLYPDSSIDENLFAALSSLPPAFEIFVDPEDLL